MTEDKREVLKKKGIGAVNNIQSDDPRVEQTRIKMESLNTLTDKDNEVFSNHILNRLFDETKSFEKACLFADRPLPGLERRLQARGITRTIKTDEEEKEEPVRIHVPIVGQYIAGVLSRRHSANRSRVEEYLTGLKNLNRNEQDQPPQRSGILSRIV